MNDEGVVALLGLVLLTVDGHEVRVPADVLESGLPDNSGVQVFRDELADELVIRIQEYGSVEEQEVMEDDETGALAE
jgi:hypothetical protein